MILTTLLSFIPLLHKADDLTAWLPMSEQAIEQAAAEATATFQSELAKFLEIESDDRTFDNTIRAWDLLRGTLTLTNWRCGCLLFIHPDKSVRDYAETTVQKINTVMFEALEQHPEIYEACQIVQDKNLPLSEPESYFLTNLLADFRRTGMQLSGEDRARFTQLSKEILSLELLFERQIQENPPALFVAKEALAGLQDSWISAREQNEKGEIRLTCDYPTYNTLIEECSVRETRRALHELFINRGAPQNESVLTELIAKRDQLARLLNFPSYAAYDLDNQMAKSTEVVENFLQKLSARAQEKGLKEFQQVTQELPEGVSLTARGQLERCDSPFVYAQYKKCHFSVNQTKIAEYFPMEKTIQGLIAIYERFFSLSIKEASHSIPIPNLRALEIRDRSEKLLGILLLDLFPREGKYTHACDYPLIPAFSPPGGSSYPAVSLVITNFTKPTKDRPSLMTHTEVSTFFHEFGHAIHDILGRSPIMSLCGTQVKTDFVELPSQLLEEWVWDPEILKQISSHYLTGEPLSEEMIQRMIEAKQFGTGTWVERQCYLAQLSLALFGAGEQKNPTLLTRKIQEETLPNYSFGEKDFSHLSFGHLAGYGAKYYSYLWSKVFALDLFEKIHQIGLLDPEIGSAYAKLILGRGGSRDPNLMLVDFLGRKPSQEPFFEHLLQSTSVD